MHDVSDESLADCLSACTISSASVSDDGVPPCEDNSFAGGSSAAATDILDEQTMSNADKIAWTTSSLAASGNSAGDSCSRRLDMARVGSSLSHNGHKQDVEAVDATLCLLHGLSHCSYHESSLLMLADHATYRPAVDLFVCLWRGLQTSQPHSEKTQACIFVIMHNYYYNLLL